jgi:hypothetical protein
MKGKEFLLNEEFKNQLTSEINSEQLMSPFSKINETLGALKHRGFQMHKTRLDAVVPEGGFKYIEWPHKLWHAMYRLDIARGRAIANAQSIVDILTLMSRRILGHVNDVRSFLDYSSDRVINTYVPLKLDSIRLSAQLSASLAREVINQLADFSDFVDEVKTATLRQSEDLTEFTNGLGRVLDEVVKMRDVWTKLADFLLTI